MNKMPLNELLRRYGLFFLSVLMQGAGIATITLADIGTTPISSPNYVLSLHTPLTLGQTTMVFNIMLIVLQVMLIGRDIRYHYRRLLLQVPVVLLFSFMIDFAMSILVLFVPSAPPYWMCWVLVLCGTLMLATSISWSFVANVCMIPGEYFLKIFHPIVNRPFSTVKTFFDIFLVITAAMYSFFFTGFTGFEGVREGTLFAALTTGPMVHLFIMLYMPLNKLLGPVGVSNLEAKRRAKEEARKQAAAQAAAPAPSQAPAAQPRGRG